jgi:hypothetical protein
MGVIIKLPYSKHCAAVAFPQHFMCADANNHDCAHRQVMLFIGSTSAVVVYAAVGTVPADYAGMLIAVTCVATATGQLAFYWIVRRTGRTSIIVLAMMIIFISATLASGGVFIKTAIGLAVNPSTFTARQTVCALAS